MNTGSLFKLAGVLALSCSLNLTTAAPSNIALNRACYQSGAADYDHTAHLVTDGHSSTYWKSKAEAQPWIYVDLGEKLPFNRIAIDWGETSADSYTIEVASTGTPERPTGWKKVYETKKGKGGREEIKLSANARYVKITCKGENKNFVIREVEVFGPRSFVPALSEKKNTLENGKLFLCDRDWMLQRESYVDGNGRKISTLDFNTEGWIPAKVPGTVLTSYLELGAIPDPNYGDQQLMISEEFFTANFWYRNVFTVPESYKGERIWLNFDGINWKSDIYLNGHKLGRTEGAFIRSNFDITEFVSTDQPNVLAVLVYKNDNPGAVTEQHLNDPDPNGGVIGFDSPTFLASIGWNWMPTIRGRNTGIWNDVYLSTTKAVSIKDPFVKTLLELPDTTKANLEIEATLVNHEDKAVSGTLEGKIGDVTFSVPVELKAKETKVLHMTPAEYPALTFNQPRLWWPNGYGPQPLYTLELTFKQGTEVSDNKEVTFGIRQYSYSVLNNNLRISVNGFPLVVRGGNWGMADAMLVCSEDRYDTYIRMHKDMNMNMIRNWIGMEGDDEFYEACDRHGIMIWDDFWLANPVDGPHPTNNAMFMENVRDKIKHFRNHAALALWTGRNEGYPPAELDSAMRFTTGELDGSRFYISSSAHRPVTGLGPYETKDPKWYFQNRGTTFHSEQGIVTPPNLQSMQAMMPEEYLWPINDMWGVHDWTQPRVQIFTDDMIRSYGAPTGIADFCKKAQMLNMEGPKALMEAWQSNRGSGVLVWMSHPAWPSMICQTYDYYYEPTAAYFAFKKGCEPIHILWRADNEKVQVANNTQQALKDAKAIVSVYGMDGTKVDEFEATVNVPANDVVDVKVMSYPANISKVHFLKMVLLDAQGKEISSNFYWRSSEYLDYNELANMAEARVNVQAEEKEKDGKRVVIVNLDNTGKDVALMFRMLLVNKKTGERVLPALYEDNYLSLVPGEKRTVTITFDPAVAGEGALELMVEGWNLSEKRYTVTK